MIDEQIISRAEQLGQALKEQGLIIATAESCTGGGVAQAITEIAGSSVWFDRGFVTYSNAAKVQMLQIKLVALDQWGAVSEQVARQMAAGAIQNSDADIAVAITGIAGPTGGTTQKPVGTVYIAWGKSGEIKCQHYIFSGDRSLIRQQVVLKALDNCLLDL